MKSKRLRRAGEKRSRLGCSTCKKRRVKCDETHPKCLRCERLSLECEYKTNLLWHDEALQRGISFGRSKQYQLIKSQRTPETKLLANTPRDSSKLVVPADNLELTLTELCRLNKVWTKVNDECIFVNTEVEDFRPASKPKTGDGYMIDIYNCINEPQFSPQFSPQFADSFQFSSSNHLTQTPDDLNLSDHLPDQFISDFTSTDFPDFTSYSIISSLPTIPLNFNFANRTKELEAYDYMINKIFPNCICYEGNNKSKYNPYLNYLVPLSVSSNILFKTLISYSAQVFSSINHEFKQISIDYKNEVIEELPELIKLKQCINLNDWEDVFGTILILCSSNISSDCDFQWIMHSEGGKKLLNKIDMAEIDPFKKFFIRYLVSHEIMRNTIKPNDESNCLIYKYIEHDNDDEIDLMLGCSPNLLKLINDSTMLADSYESLEHESASNKIILQDLILSKTSSLLDELDTSNQVFHGIESSKSFEIKLIAEIKQMSTKLYLYARINLFYCKINAANKFIYNNICHEIDNMIDLIVDKIKLLDYTTMSITWPLFLIGILSVNSSEELKWFILKKFKDMETLRGLANIRIARNSVEKVWKYRDLNDEVNLTWKDLMNFNVETLSLA